MTTQRSNDGWLRILVVVLGAIFLFPLLMMAVMMPMMGWWWTDGGGMAGGLSPLWGVGMLLVWLVVLGGIGYLLYRGVAGTFQRQGETDPALEELRLAYARGDISEDEFEKRRSRLRRNE